MIEAAVNSFRIPDLRAKIIFTAIILGLYLPSSEVGRYNVIGRLMLLAAMAMVPINASFAPRIADLYHARLGDKQPQPAQPTTGAAVSA